MLSVNPRRAKLATLLLGALSALIGLEAPASGYSSELRRYPYLTDVVETSATVNFGTDRSAATAVVKWGRFGQESCTEHTTTATNTPIAVNSVPQYQWKATFSVEPDTEYCYRVFLGDAPEVDLLGADDSPRFRSQIPAGSTTPYSFAVIGDWGLVGGDVLTGPGENSHMANVISRIAESDARFAVTVGDNVYASGTQTEYGDLVQSGTNMSAMFGPSFWKQAGASKPIFPALGNHGHSNANHLVNWPQDVAVASSGGRYQTDTYCCLNDTQSREYPSPWYAFDAGNARFYVLDTAWSSSNVGSADQYKNDYDYHWAPGSPQYEWLQNDLASNPRTLKFAIFHYPLYSDQADETSDPWLQGPNGLEGLLDRHGVNMGFTGHGHVYQRNLEPPGGIVTYLTGGGGAHLQPTGGHGCSPLNAYGLGWSYSANMGAGGGSACGAATPPVSTDQVHHYLHVTVNGTTVTVTPIDELGRVFDQVTYAPPANDLSLTQSDSPDPVTPGETLTYTLTAGNLGSQQATDVTVTDNLPAGVTFQSATPTQGTCSEVLGTVTCEVGGLTSGESAAVEINVVANDDGTLTNNASVASQEPDVEPANNAASEDTTVRSAADLSVTQTDSPDPIAPGETLSYSLSVSNAGPNGATGVTVTDALPAGVTYQSATSSQGTCAETSGIVSCALGTVSSGAGATVSIDVTPQAEGTITNSATVSGSEFDTNGSNNNTSAQTTVSHIAALSVTNEDSPDPVLLGQPVTYTLRATNSGPSSATGVTLTDDIPAGMTFQSAAPSQGSCTTPSPSSPPTFTPEADAYVDGANAATNFGLSSRIRLDTSPDLRGYLRFNLSGLPWTITNATLRVHSFSSNSAGYQVRGVSDNLWGETALNYGNKPAMGPVVVSSGPTTTNAWTETNVTSLVTGNGQLSLGLTGINSTAMSLGSRESGATSPQLVVTVLPAASVTCDLGTLTSGSSATVEVQVLAQALGMLTNSASVDSNELDPSETDNAASQDTTVSAGADLSLAKSDSADPALVGEPFTYTLTASNSGAETATSVTLTDTLPEGVDYVSSTPSQGACSEASGAVTCNLGDIGLNGSASVEVQVVPTAVGTVTNTASVQSAVPDPDGTDNSASETTTVDPVADLQLTKTDIQDPGLAGSNLTYALDVANSGPSDATSVTLTDTLPAGVTFQSASPSQGTCSEAAGTVTCELGALAASSSATVQLAVRPGSAGEITNNATVSGAEHDPSQANNSDAETTQVSPAADLRVTKTDSPDPVALGQDLTFTLTATNLGPSPASSVVITDALPASFSYQSVTASQGSCSEAASTVTCELGSLSASAQATVTLVVRPQATGHITNTASTSAEETDLIPANNSATQVTRVDPAADLHVTKTDSPDPVSVGSELTYTIDVENQGPSSATSVRLVDALPAGPHADPPAPADYQPELPIRAGFYYPWFPEAWVQQGFDPFTQYEPSLGLYDSRWQTLIERHVREMRYGGMDAAITSWWGQGHRTDQRLPALLDTTEQMGSPLRWAAYHEQEGSSNPSVSEIAADLAYLRDNYASHPAYLKIGGRFVVFVYAGAGESCELANRWASANQGIDAYLVLKVFAGYRTCANQPSGWHQYIPAVAADSQAGYSYTISPGFDKRGEAGPRLERDLSRFALNVRNMIASNAPFQLITSYNEWGEGTSVESALEWPSASGYGDYLDILRRDGQEPGIELPQGATFVSANPSQGTCTHQEGTVICDLGSLASAASASVQVVVRPEEDGEITNTAAVDALQRDTDFADNVASADTTVDPVADLSLTKSDSPDPVAAGSDLTYTLDVANAGPSEATAVNLTDTLPAGVTFHSADPSQGSCSETSGTVTCDLGTLEASSSATVQIVVRPESAGEITNSASVSSAAGDPDAANNSASATSTVLTPADVSITKGDSPDPVHVGSALTYTLDVANAGPADATSVTATDDLPAGVTYQSASASQGGCTEASGTVTCDLGTIAASSSATVEIVVRPGAVGEITNTASVVAAELDSNSANNSASETTTVDPLADLSITKSDSVDPVLLGSHLGYTLDVANSGPSDASLVTVTDVLPASVTYISAVPSQGLCTELLGTVTCQLGALAASGSASIEIVVRPQGPGEISNSASVAALESDPDAGNNSASQSTTVSPVADLALTKSDSPDLVAVGSAITYTLDVANGGPSEATSVAVTDELPAGVTYQSATPSQGSCSETSGSVTCDLGTLGASSSATIQIVVGAGTAGEITNTASVSAIEEDTDAADNSASATTTVVTPADLSIRKSDSADPVLLGSDLTYTLDVANAGPADATSVTATDDLPAGVTYQSASASQGGCTEASGTVTCDLGTIAASSSATVEIVVRPGAVGEITNTASVVAAELDSNPADSSASETTTVDPVADLTLTKTDSADPALAGSDLTYTLDVANGGPSEAASVTLSDALPAGVTYRSATASQGTCSESSGTVTCDLGTIDASASASVQIVVMPQSAGEITNSASVSSAAADPSPADNAAFANTTVVIPTDLSLTKTDSPDPVLVGGDLTYTLDVANAGPSDATSVTLTDELPAGVTYQSATPSQGTCNEASGTVTCDLGTISASSSASAQIVVQPQSAGQITNTASVEGAELDGDGSNDSASESTTVNPVADLALRKSDSPDPVRVGQELTYTLDVANGGPSDATLVTVTDELPTGVTYQSATPSQGTCSEASGTVTCDLGTVDASSSATVEVVVRPQGTEEITNSASVSSSAHDPNAADNSASVTTTVDPVADLSLTKSDSPDPALVGSDLTYTLDVANAGPSDATGVTLTDELPAGVSYQSATPSQGTCNEASGTVSCDLGTIAASASATIEIVVRTDSAGEITNSASVSATEHDPNAADNSASESTTVDPVADLTLTKTDSPDPVAVGADLTYTLDVANAGPSDATAVALTDELPAGLTYQSATPSQGSCSETSGIVTCDLETLGSSSSASVQIVVRPQSAGEITNSASVSSSAHDPNPSDNSASESTTVDPVADLTLTKTGSPDPVAIGSDITYTLDVANAGPSDATGVTLTDELPTGVTYQSATPSQGTCNEASGTVTCDLGALAASSSAAVQVVVRADSAGEITNSASASATEHDPNAADNSASESTTVDPVADLSLTKSDSPGPVLVGADLTYTLDVANAGPSDATGVTLTDELPAGVTYQSATPSQGTCNEASGTVTCDLGTLAASSSATVQIVVRPGGAGEITNSASVDAAEIDSNEANNSASVTTTVDPVADLTLTKTDSPDPVAIGSDLTYTLDVANAGPSDATSLTVTDELPAGVTYQSATPSQGTCNEASGTVTCDLGALAASSSATVQIVVRADSAGEITNSASASAAEHDPNAADNSASESTTVDPVADLSLTKIGLARSRPGRLPTSPTPSTSRTPAPQTPRRVTLTDELPSWRHLPVGDALAGHLQRGVGDRHL